MHHLAQSEMTDEKQHQTHTGGSVGTLSREWGGWESALGPTFNPILMWFWNFLSIPPGNCKALLFTENMKNPLCFYHSSELNVSGHTMLSSSRTFPTANLAIGRQMDWMLGLDLGVWLLDQLAVYCWEDKFNFGLQFPAFKKYGNWTRLVSRAFWCTIKNTFVSITHTQRYCSFHKVTPNFVW